MQHQEYSAIVEKFSGLLDNIKRLNETTAKQDELFKQLAIALRLKQAMNSSHNSNVYNGEKPLHCEIKVVKHDCKYLLSLALINNTPLDLCGWIIVCQVSFSFLVEGCERAGPTAPKTLTLKRPLPNLYAKSSVTVEVLVASKKGTMSLDLAYCEACAPDDCSVPLMVDFYLCRSFSMLQCCSDNDESFRDLKSTVLISLHRTVIDLLGPISVISTPPRVFCSSQLLNAEMPKNLTLDSPLCRLTAADKTKIAAVNNDAKILHKTNEFIVSFSYSFLNLVGIPLDEKLPCRFLTTFLFLSPDTKISCCNVHEDVLTATVNFHSFGNSLTLYLHRSTSFLTVSFSVSGNNDVSLAQNLLLSLLVRSMALQANTSICVKAVSLQNAKALSQYCTGETELDTQCSLYDVSLCWKKFSYISQHLPLV